MDKEKKVALVTGANRGIGLEICRQLVQEGFRVILTGRDEARVKTAAEQLKSSGIAVDIYVLDVTDPLSIVRAAKNVEAKYGRCDVLVNNAGIFPDTESNGSSWPSVLDTDVDVVRRAMETNVYGPIKLCQKFIPLMKKNNYGRIVNLSSGMGQLTYMNGGCPGYRISKTAINALTRILADELKNENILINSMCPGWVKTEMGGPGATREVAEGADTAVWLSTLPDDGPTGKFFRDRKEFPW